MNEQLIGSSMKVEAAHAGHTVTVVRRDIEKHKAFWLECECGATTTIGEHWLPDYVARGVIPHRVFE